MERVRIAALFADKEQYGGASVTVCGWAKTIRDMKTCQKSTQSGA